MSTPNNEKTTTKSARRGSNKKASNEAKWGKEIMAHRFTTVPNALLNNIVALKLRAPQVMVLLMLLQNWWEKDRLPFPSLKTIADRIGIQKAAVQKTIRGLAAKKIIAIKHRKDEKRGHLSNEYSFEPLIVKLKALSEDATAMNLRHKREQARRKARSNGAAND
jgi:predicted transcriptional regulator